MDQFCVPNRLKAIKKTSSGLRELHYQKNFEFYLRAFFIKLFSVFAFLSHLETSHFLHRDSINDKPPLQSIEAQ